MGLETSLGENVVRGNIRGNIIMGNVVSGKIL
jgi:hypothetical protein